MKKAAVVLFLLAFSLLFALAQPTVTASETNLTRARSSSSEIQVDQLTHHVEIQDYGLVVINDTLQLSSESGGWLRNFSIGIPFQYGFHLDYSFAYAALDPNDRLEVDLDVGLAGHIGFYGIHVGLPGLGVDLGEVDSYNLTVIFVFSNLLSYETDALFTLNFPMYPGLLQEAAVCQVTVVLPPGANYTDSPFDFNVSTRGSTQVLNHTQSPLGSLQHQPTSLQFNPGAVAFPLIEFNEVRREITLNQGRDLRVFDHYRVTNRGFNIARIDVRLPEGAYSISARDTLGALSVRTQEENTTINLRTGQAGLGLAKDVEAEFTVAYRLPWKTYVTPHGGHYYNLTSTILEHIHGATGKLSVAITLPEGAEFHVSNPIRPDSVEKSPLQETVTFTFFNVTQFQLIDFDLTYGYLVFWASFRPTLWMGILVLVLGAVALFWRAPRPPSISIVPVPPENLRSFVEAYERKTAIQVELESMEQKLRKGKIPRRRYKVRKKMLEGRVSTLSRDLSGLREKIIAGGPKYANIMRQIEVAETMLAGVEPAIRIAEARYKRGDLSKGAYRRLLEDYNNRRERAKTTIDGVLLRLSEEFR